MTNLTSVSKANGDTLDINGQSVMFVNIAGGGSEAIILFKYWEWIILGDDISSYVTISNVSGSKFKMTFISGKTINIKYRYIRLYQ